MNKENLKDLKITGEVLENKEMLEEVMNMFAPLLATYGKRIEQLKTQLTKEESEMQALMDRFEILEKYKVFLNCKGFHIAKEAVKEHAAEIAEAQKERIPENDFLCGLSFSMGGFQGTCMREEDHDGPCGFPT